MMYDLQKHHRRSIRLKGYDYRQSGAYFVTLCTRERECLFGEVTDGEMALNEYGRLVHDEWLRSAEIRDEIQMDQFVVMPNHLHGIVIITRDPVGTTGLVGAIGWVGAHGRAPLRRVPKSLGSLIAGFKPIVAKRINEQRCTPGLPIWQRNYYERIIRDENELSNVRCYIRENPARWEMDENHPKCWAQTKTKVSQAITERG
ncbi:MAG: hypothetical protein A2Z21_06155 [Candidatus Fraserbacteria bacterium RBG_16_55_9]|uniref:Transposase IS200-like domain-containing protein n=1 Tax=Fraserbacteria sp. (strain RBG_16_55_9) TaxID=1817864 RepID=A0A1F5V2E5_FRAXR|nr:MAG: hypothetical protein A2Z21_06155 [Candidatus Fraserbacteria bacterium RBG_16_55_9]